jgi:hypothetical protein
MDLVGRGSVTCQSLDSKDINFEDKEDMGREAWFSRKESPWDYINEIPNASHYFEVTL